MSSFKEDIKNYTFSDKCDFPAELTKGVNIAAELILKEMEAFMKQQYDPEEAESDFYAALLLSVSQRLTKL